ncbi:MAG: HNH endonuclease [Parvibaculales bacterium]
MPKTGAKTKIKQFLSKRIGQIVDGEEIAKVAGITEWARRVRELREDEGWQIETHNDATDLKPGQYRVVSINPKKNTRFSRKISARLRAFILDRNGLTCQMCGAAAGDIDPETNRRVRLHVGHIVDKEHGGTEDPNNLRALCSTCNQGAKHLTHEPPSWTFLLAQIRRATRDDQLKALEWLRNKFKAREKEKIPDDEPHGA